MRNKITLLLMVSLGIGAIGCSDDSSTAPRTGVKELPNTIGSVTQIDTIAATGVLPLYRG